MPAFHHENPSSESKQFSDRQEVERAVSIWEKFLSEADLKNLLDNAKEPESTDDGIIYEVETPPELVGDFAIVDMRGVKVDTPHSHQDHDNGDEETEIHFALEGSAKMSIGSEEVIELQAGDTYIVNPRTSHFVMPELDYVVGVLSLPGYDPEKQIPIDTTDPPTDFNSDLYFEVLGQ